jgi:hypothetical protein
MTKTVVNVVAFDLSFSNGITVDDLFQFMVLNQKIPISVGGYTSQIISQIHQGFIFGIFIANKGDKSFLTTVQDGTKLKVKKIILDENQTSTQASVFCIEPGSRSGMFYTYHGGVSVHSFSELLRKIHDKARREAVKTLQKEKKKYIKDLLVQYFSGEFRFKVKFTQLDLDSLLEKYQNISSVEIAMGPAIEPSSIFRPLTSFASGFKTVVDLDGKQSPQGKIAAVRAFLNSVTNRSMMRAFKIAGKGLSGEPLTAKFGQNLDHFGSFFLDDYLAKLPGDDVDWDKFVECEAAVELLKIVRQNVAVIPSPPPVSDWKTRKNIKDLNGEEE